MAAGAAPRILLVGAGAVGQVYGRHLQLGGADISFLVRPQYAAAVRRGFDLYPLRKRGRRDAVRLQDFAVLTETAAVAAQRWDAVFLCVSSPALYQGDWLAELAAATGDASIVTLQPGLTDHARACAVAGAERVVAGMIGLMAYAAPLPGEPGVAQDRPGTAYWFPPLGKCPFSGAPARVRPLVALLRQGGFPAACARDVPAQLAFGVALLDPHMVALEVAGFSLRSLRADRALLARAAAASREATAITAAFRGVRAPRFKGALERAGVRVLLAMLPRLAPLDVEGFFRAHYTKVGGQTRALLATYRAEAAARGLPTPALTALSAELEARA